MTKTVEITPEVRDVLERGHWPAEDLFQLPDGQLDRKLYVDVDKVLKALGGKWNRGRQGHIFPGPAREKFDAAMKAGEAVDQKRTMEQFFTPPDLADRLVEMVEPGPDDSVLEPSAGAGALLEALVRGGVDPANITALELDSDLYRTLHDRWGLASRVIAADFLAMPTKKDRFDIVVMNPPFGRCADIAHVSRALELLNPGGRLCAIMSPHWTFANDQASQKFRGLVNEHHHVWDALPDGSFRASGTGVSTGILSITKRSI